MRIITREPILWIGLVIAVLQVVHAFMSGATLDTATLQGLFTAVGAVIGRQLVSPVAEFDNAVALGVKMDQLMKEKAAE